MRRNSGFTLIELVVVLLVLGILAGLVVPVVGWIRRSANYANSSNNQGTLIANLELYRTTFGNGSYPDRFDSLLTGTAVPSYFDSTLAGMIDVDTFDADEFASINNSGRGLTTVMDHTDPLTGAIEGNPGNSGVVARAITATSTMAFINPAATGSALTNVNQLAAALGYELDTATGKYRAIGATTPGDIRLLLLGIGPSNLANGRTLQSPPFDTNVDTSKTYNRFIGVFTVYSPREGRRSQLKAILCPRGRIINRNLSEFYQSNNPE
ncbi:MAG TPA: type II secretion system protein [Planctomycetota bacterium]|nr:type II secretion system protein [Planctomycetota bacterium]